MAVAMVGFGAALAAVVVIGGGSVVELCLVVILFGYILLRWLSGSWTLETLRRWRERR